MRLLRTPPDEKEQMQVPIKYRFKGEALYAGRANCHPREEKKGPNRAHRRKIQGAEVMPSRLPTLLSLRTRFSPYEVAYPNAAMTSSTALGSARLLSLCQGARGEEVL